MERYDLGSGIILYENVYKDYYSLYNKIKSSPISWTQRFSAFDAGYYDVKPRSVCGNYTSLNLEQNRDPDLRLEFQKMHPVFVNTVSDYYSFLDETFNWYEGMTLIKYSEGDFFEKHSDSLTPNGRKHSIFYYINDDYEGGELNFLDFNLSIKPPANSIVVFPSRVEYLHEVKEVISGTKYVLASFLR